MKDHRSCCLHTTYNRPPTTKMVKNYVIKGRLTKSIKQFKIQVLFDYV